MKRAVCLLAVVIAGGCFAHVRASASASAGGIDPVFPSAQASVQQSSYPQAQSSWDLTTPEVQRLIEERLTSESALENTRIEVKTDDSAVVLTGEVSSDRLRELASEIAKAYAGNRRVENHIEVRGI
jgi:osmotically-inducible protein OsmY